jgi:hypothetical protein
MHYQDVISFLAGSTVIGLIAHAVDTFPTPANKYGQWFLGNVQFIVGQRVKGMNTIQGKDSAVIVTGTSKE